jgi:tetratricopeptide (TPR) repeat protein
MSGGGRSARVSADAATIDNLPEINLITCGEFSEMKNRRERFVMRKWIARRANDFFAWIRLLPWRVKRPLQWFWQSIPSHLAFYLLLIVVVYAIWNGWQRETVISPFHLPPENKDKPMPFSGETVASMLQDAFTAIQMEAEGGKAPAPCDEFAAKDIEFWGLAAPASGAFQVSSPVGVEVKGISVEALVSEARAVLGRERSISGDVLLDEAAQFRMVARASDAGPWTVGPYPLKLEGLKNASCEMAQKILESTDKNLAAAALIRRGAYQQVIGLYEVLPDGKRNLADAFNNLGIALRQSDRVDESIINFQNALNLKTRFPEAHYNLGVALNKKGKHGEAIVEYQKALALKPDYAMAHNNLGSALTSEGRNDEAIAEYQKALALKPDYALAHFDLGIVLGRSGKHDKAVVECEQALSLDSSLVKYGKCPRE